MGRQNESPISQQEPVMMHPSSMEASRHLIKTITTDSGDIYEVNYDAHTGTYFPDTARLVGRQESASPTTTWGETVINRPNSDQPVKPWRAEFGGDHFLVHGGSDHDKFRAASAYAHFLMLGGQAGSQTALLDIDRASGGQPRLEAPTISQQPQSSVLTSGSEVGFATESDPVDRPVDVFEPQIRAKRERKSHPHRMKLIKIAALIAISTTGTTYVTESIAHNVTKAVTSDQNIFGKVGDLFEINKNPLAGWEGVGEVFSPGN